MWIFFFVNLAAASPWLRRSWSPNYSVLVYYSASCSIFERCITFDCIDQFWQFILIIACVGDISRFPLYTCHYPVQTHNFFFTSVSSPLFSKFLVTLSQGDWAIFCVVGQSLTNHALNKGHLIHQSLFSTRIPDAAQMQRACWTDDWSVSLPFGICFCNIFNYSSRLKCNKSNFTNEDVNCTKLLGLIWQTPKL
jgi:hypothetical protein